MARYTEANCRLCRRAGEKLFLKGNKCSSAKCTIAKRATPPGQHGSNRVKLSNYGVQLREKQKVKWMYGVLEQQFRTYFKHAAKIKGEPVKSCCSFWNADLIMSFSVWV